MKAVLLCVYTKQAFAVNTRGAKASFFLKNVFSEADKDLSSSNRQRVLVAAERNRTGTHCRVQLKINLMEKKELQ